MNEFVLFTDSACDIAPATLEAWGVGFRTLSFQFDGDSAVYHNDEMSTADFYARMRSGGVAKTSAVNAESFLQGFEQILQGGKDLLYLGFSSGLSATYQAGRVAAAELAEKYPERRIITVDTLCASVGQGLIVKMAVDMKAQGATMEEIVDRVESVKKSVCHWVTVEDLVYLKRGGRINPALAFVGNALGLKPMIRVDNDGKLESVAKVRGRKKALAALVEKFGEAADPTCGPLFIGHADCETEAREVARGIEMKYGVVADHVGQIGPVIGAHAGPGTIVICFVGNER